MASSNAADLAALTEQQQLIEWVWGNGLDQLEAGSHEIIIPDNICTALGQRGVAAIADRYSAMIDARVSAVHDNSLNSVRMLPPPKIGLRMSDIAVASTVPAASLQSRVTANPKAKVAKDRLAKIPRPPNAFILYRQDKHPIVKMNHPYIHNNQISVIIGNMWKNETAEVKATYKDKAEAAKRKHMADHPQYQYQPRKPSEKKRRMTKNKGAKIDAAPSQIGSPETDNLSTAASDLVETFDASFFSLGEENALPAGEPNVEFQTFENQAYITCDFDAQQSGQLLLRAEEHNENVYNAGVPMLNATVNPQLIFDVGDDNFIEHESLLSGLNVDGIADSMPPFGEFAVPRLTPPPKPRKEKVDYYHAEYYEMFDGLNDFFAKF